MTVYGGFAPGTYQAWALNLLASVFCTAGIARAMQVTQNTPAGMTVLVTVDPVAGDGICYLPNGAFLRIDAQATLSVPSNGTGSTRMDAVVAQVDPTGGTNPTLSYITNWVGGFNGASNQFVLATVSVASGAISITSGNITQNSARANFNNSGSATNLNNALFASNNTASGGVFVSPVQITGTLEGYTVQVWNGSQLVNVIGIGTNSVSSLSYLDLLGNLGVINLTASSLILYNGKVGYSTTGDMFDAGAGPDMYIKARPGGIFHFQSPNGSDVSTIDTLGTYHGPLLNNATTTGARWFITGTQPTNATVGDVWIRTDTTLP